VLLNKAWFAAKAFSKLAILLSMLKVVSDDSALMVAIEAAIAAQPDTAERIRGGNIPAAGALIGAVMKATGGQADAAKVRELLLRHLGQG
jgi:aspartyl-tRNA(Asn)/glutamyl-tRNA(Gln) amidotransferase subunit B